jgi:hypothetical protein
VVLRGSHLLSSDEEPDPGVGQAYLGGYTDADGDWPSTTSAPLLDRQRSATRRPGLPHPDLVTNDDGSVDLHIGPTAQRAGVELDPNRSRFEVGL